MDRSRAIVEINDGTASIRTSIASPDLEKFIPFTPQEVKDAEEKVRISFLQIINYIFD